jgi:hypothetical protein
MVKFLTQPVLSTAEQRVYDLVCQSDVMCKQLSPNESGAVPSLVQKGLIEIYKKDVSPYRVKIIKYLRKV